jgi:hypothetical protein
MAQGQGPKHQKIHRLKLWWNAFPMHRAGPDEQLQDQATLSTPEVGYHSIGQVERIM